MVRWSQSRSITSKILRDTLAIIDHYQVMDRTFGRLSFLEYITNADHKWMVCIGVSFRTSLWQVTDSKEQNSSYKIAMSKTKSEILKETIIYGSSKTFSLLISFLTSTMLSMNHLQEFEINKKASAERGWGYLNFNFLINDDLKRQ